MSSTPHPSRPPEPGSVDGARKLRNHQTDSVFEKLTDQESLAGGAYSSKEPSHPPERDEDEPAKERGDP